MRPLVKIVTTCIYSIIRNYFAYYPVTTVIIKPGFIQSQFLVS